ncbi:MAG: UvrD-helicase domain-containing protein [Chloroflexi bacterium]|nr:UvrD-helicase domain-containing protein [Chloroflexota bacterium]
MTVEFWMGKEPDTTHEMQAREQIIKLFQKEFASESHLISVAFDFHCGEDLDLAIFKSDAIIVVELKDCEAPVIGKENGNWIIENTEKSLKGGNTDNPFQQVRKNRYSLMGYLKDHRESFLSKQKADQSTFEHVSGIVAFSPKKNINSKFDFDFGKHRWFHIVGLPELAEIIKQIRSTKIRLQNDEIRKLIKDVLGCIELNTNINLDNEASNKEIFKSINELPALTTRKYTVGFKFTTSLPKTINKLPGYLEELNEQQRLAVLHSDSHLLILAGAGTGKTDTLILRAAYLLEKCQPSEILLMTFTNKAAHEMYQRLSRVTRNNIDQLWIGTFHSICRRILVENASLLGYSPEFAIVDQYESEEIFKRCIPNNIYVNTRDLQSIYSFSRNSMENWKNAPSSDNINIKEDLAEKIFNAYQRRLKRSDRMDFDDLLTNTVSLLEKHVAVRKKYQEQFKYILVDEYQDTSPIQAHLLKLLANKNNVTVVGDDAQAIYGFRAARIENILNFETVFHGAKELRLEENYRNTPQILKLANENISNNKQRKQKTLFTNRSSDQAETPWVCIAKNQAMEASFIVTRILELNQMGYKLGDISVLFRSGFQKAQIELALIQADIPYEITGAKSFFGESHIKDIIAWLRLVINPNDTISLGNVFRQQSSNVFKIFQTLEEESENQDIKFWDLVQKKYSQLELLSKKSLEGIIQTISRLQKRHQNSNIPDLIQFLLDERYLSYLQKAYPNDWESKQEDIQVFQDLAGHYNTIENLLTEMTLERIEVKNNTSSSNFETGEKIMLSSIHAAKGLQWRCVFIIGMVESWMPSNKAADVEEERRLFHVAITRAKELLHITYPKLTADYNKEKQTAMTPSIFLRELPSESYQIIEINQGN